MYFYHIFQDPNKLLLKLKLNSTSQFNYGFLYFLSYYCSKLVKNVYFISRVGVSFCFSEYSSFEYS